MRLAADSPCYDLVRKNRDDERRHKDWIEAVLIADDLEAGARRAAKHGDDHRSGLRR